jgi:hypothetical protein
MAATSHDSKSLKNDRWEAPSPKWMCFKPDDSDMLSWRTLERLFASRSDRLHGEFLGFQLKSFRRMTHIFASNMYKRNVETLIFYPKVLESYLSNIIRTTETVKIGGK